VYFETTSPVTDVALDLAKIGALFGEVDAGLLGQAPVPVPAVMPAMDPVLPLEVSSDDGQQATTQPLLDVAQVAMEQNEANLPWVVARAVLRRTLKATVANKATKGISDEGARTFWKIIANIIWTATERADLRHWTSLPAQFQAAHLYLPEGERVLDLGYGMQTPVRVRAGYSSFVVVVQPNPTVPGAVLVDRFSEVGPPLSELAQEAAPAPTADPAAPETADEEPEPVEAIPRP
jgi:hypothetical protein